MTRYIYEVRWAFGPEVRAFATLAAARRWRRSMAFVGDYRIVRRKAR